MAGERRHAPEKAQQIPVAGGHDWGRMRKPTSLTSRMAQHKNPWFPRGFRTSEEAWASLRKRPRPDSNRGITVLQTVALPLGDEADNSTGMLSATRTPVNHTGFAETFDFNRFPSSLI